MDLKIILLFCIVVAVAASEVRQNLTQKPALRYASQGNGQGRKGKEIPRITARYEYEQDFEDYQQWEDQSYTDNPQFERRRSRAKSRQYESAQPSYKETLHHIETSFNGFMNTLEAEYTPDEVKESVLDLMFDVFMGWHNHTLKGDGANLEETSISTRSKAKKMKREQSELGKISSFCNFLSILTGFMDQCQGREQECLQNLAQMMTEQQQQEKPMKRSANAHQPVLEAVKELADRLENSHDPNDQSMVLLANALLQLYNDLQTHKPSVEANVMVLLDVYNILQKVDNCVQNPQCCDDWYKAYGEYA